MGDRGQGQPVRLRRRYFEGGTSAGGILPVQRNPHAGEVALDELQRNLRRVELEMEDLVAEQNALSRWIFLLSKKLAVVEDERVLDRAGRQSREVDTMFVVQGWSPTPGLPALQRLAEAKGLALLQEDPGPDEMPPTLMDNPGPFQGGEDLVTFYETPGYRSLDPSLIVAFSFAVFFAMILSDAGYALVLAAILFLVRNKLGSSAGGRRFRFLMFGVLSVAFVYGVLAGSYFGLEPPPGSLLGALYVVHLKRHRIDDAALTDYRVRASDPGERLFCLFMGGSGGQIEADWMDPCDHRRPGSVLIARYKG